MLRPCGGEAVDPIVEQLQGSDFVVRQLVAHDHDEVDVAVLIEVADGK